MNQKETVTNVECRPHRFAVGDEIIHADQDNGEFVVVAALTYRADVMMIIDGYEQGLTSVELAPTYTVVDSEGEELTDVLCTADFVAWVG